MSTTPGHLVRRAQQVHTALWSRRLHGELTGPQYAVLVALADEPGIDQTKLGDLASLDKNTAADVIRRLVSQGWIDRTQDVGDRRRRLLRLTASATMALRYITPAAAGVQADLLAPVPADARDGLIDMLALVAYSRGSRPSATVGSAGDVVPVLTMSRTPGYLIRRTQQVHAALWSEIVGSELTGPQYAVLSTLARQPGLDQVSVGRLASLDRSSTADIAGRLARTGWVVRETHPGDARRSTMSLARGTQARLRRITPLALRVQTELTAALPAGRVDDFTRDLSLIAYQGSLLVD